MKKKEFKNPLVIISFLILVATVFVFLKYYFVLPIVKEKEKFEVSLVEKDELQKLTIAYLNQNNGLVLNKYLSNEAAGNKYKVAAEYYYLKNGKDYLDSYDKILELGKTIFNTGKISFANFTINIDDEHCGKEKYSTLEGYIYNDKCDDNNFIYEVNDIYGQGNEYIVEFYAAKVTINKIKPKEKCSDFEIPIGHKIELKDLFDKQYFEEEYFICCKDNCQSDSNEYIKEEILKQVKINDGVYKLIFNKIRNNFVFLKIDKDKNNN